MYISVYCVTYRLYIVDDIYRLFTSTILYYVEQLYYAHILYGKKLVDDNN